MILVKNQIKYFFLFLFLIFINSCQKNNNRSIISGNRELEINAIVGTSNGSYKLLNEDEVTMSCAEGETGQVYKGSLDFEMTVCSNIGPNRGVVR